LPIVLCSRLSTVNSSSILLNSSHTCLFVMTFSLLFDVPGVPSEAMEPDSGLLQSRDLANFIFAVDHGPWFNDGTEFQHECRLIPDIKQSSWQRQTLKFGHDEGDKYSSLVFDNRGESTYSEPLLIEQAN
jgi:hypothetical protein